jgi:hypothetical protein
MSEIMGKYDSSVADRPVLSSVLGEHITDRYVARLRTVGPVQNKHAEICIHYY